jgi:hypothetical protein
MSRLADVPKYNLYSGDKSIERFCIMMGEESANA